MSKLSESEYEEYMELLKVWVQADKALEEQTQPSGGEAAAQARSAYAAVQDFRSRYGLDGEERGAVAQPVAEGRR